MATRHRKGRRLRGSRTCGWGTSGQHRESGRRGGFGQAGRYRHKRSLLVRTGEFSDMRYAGKKGFNSVAEKRRTFPERSMNLFQLVGLVDKLAQEKKLQMQANVPVIDLHEFGFTKLLGAGSVPKAIRVKVENCSESALRKLKDAGGDAILDQPIETRKRET